MARRWYNGVVVLFFSGSAISRRFVKVLEPGTAVGSNPVSVVAKMFVGWLTVRGGRLLVEGRVCREYLIIVGSIPNGAARKEQNHNTIVPAPLGIEPTIIKYSRQTVSM